MILAVDIGNTNIVLGAIEGERILFLERMATDRSATETEYLVRIRSVLLFRNIRAEELEGAIMGASIITGDPGVETTGHEINEINADTYVFDTENNKTWNDTGWN